MSDEKQYDRELKDYFKSLQNDPKRLAIYEQYKALVSAYYPEWLPARIDRDIWRRAVSETVLRIMMVQEIEQINKLNKESMRNRYRPEWECPRPINPFCCHCC